MSIHSPQKKRLSRGLSIFFGVIACALIVVGVVYVAWPLILAGAAVAAVSFIGYAGYALYLNQQRMQQPSMAQDIPAASLPVIIAVPPHPQPTTIPTPCADKRIDPLRLFKQNGGAALEVRQILGLPSQATSQDCLTHCRKQLHHWHPDKNADIQALCNLPESDPLRTQTRDCVIFWSTVYQMLSGNKDQSTYWIDPPTKHMTISITNIESEAVLWQRAIHIYDHIDALLIKSKQLTHTLQEGFAQTARDQEKIAQDQVEMRRAQAETRRIQDETVQAYAETRSFFREAINWLKQISAYQQDIRQHIVQQHQHLKETQHRLSFFGELRTKLCEAQHLGFKLAFQATDKERRHSFSAGFSYTARSAEPLVPLEQVESNPTPRLESTSCDGAI